MQKHIYSWLILTAVTSILTAPAHAAVVAWYRFEGQTPGTSPGDVADSSVNGYDGVGVGGPVYSSSVGMNPIFPGDLTNTGSLSFNGSNQRVFIPDYPALQLTQSLTLEAWIDAGSISSPSGEIIFRGDDHGGYDPYQLFTSNGGNTVNFAITNSSDVSATLSAPIPMNQWIEVAGTLDDATGIMRLYVNGVLADINITTVRPLGALDPSASPGVAIGGLQSSNPQLNPCYFNGLIDEVRISDTALAPGQLLIPEPTSLGFASLCLTAVFATRRRVLKAS